MLVMQVYFSHTKQQHANLVDTLQGVDIEKSITIARFEKSFLLCYTLFILLQVGEIAWQNNGIIKGSMKLLKSVEIVNVLKMLRQNFQRICMRPLKP